jgi:plasmid maintenance system killer protein
VTGTSSQSSTLSSQSSASTSSSSTDRRQSAPIYPQRGDRRDSEVNRQRNDSEESIIISAIDKDALRPLQEDIEKIVNEHLNSISASFNAWQAASVKANKFKELKAEQTSIASLGKEFQFLKLTSKIVPPDPDNRNFASEIQSELVKCERKLAKLYAIELERIERDALTKFRQAQDNYKEAIQRKVRVFRDSLTESEMPVSDSFRRTIDNFVLAKLDQLRLHVTLLHYDRKKKTDNQQEQVRVEREEERKLDVEPVPGIRQYIDQRVEQRIQANKGNQNASNRQHSTPAKNGSRAGSQTPRSLQQQPRRDANQPTRNKSSSKKADPSVNSATRPKYPPSNKKSGGQGQGQAQRTPQKQKVDTGTAIFSPLMTRNQRKNKAMGGKGRGDGTPDTERSKNARQKGGSGKKRGKGNRNKGDKGKSKNH